MGHFPQFPQDLLNPGGGWMLSSAATMAAAGAGGAPTATAWPAANRALFIPVRTPVPVTIKKFIVGIGTASPIDVGLYDTAGNRLVSSGATTTSAAEEKEVDVTDTPISAGLYYLALAHDTNSETVMMLAFGTAGRAKFVGAMEMDTAYPLPATATYAAFSSAGLPLLGAVTGGF